MAKLEGVRACVFDAYGTLFDVASPVKKLATEIGAAADALGNLWRQKQLEYTWLRSLMGVHADFWHVTGEALDFALESLGISEPGLKDELMALYLKLETFPEVAEAVQTVKARSLRPVILSNGSPSMLDSMLRAAGLDRSFDLVLSVEEVGIYKPSRRAYRLAMQRLQLHDAPSVCFVSANAWDAQAAAQFGFQAVRVNRAGTPPDRIPGKVAATISDLKELPSLL